MSKPKSLFVVMAGRTPIAIVTSRKNADRLRDITKNVTYMPKSVNVVVVPFWKKVLL